MAWFGVDSMGNNDIDFAVQEVRKRVTRLEGFYPQFEKPLSVLVFFDRKNIYK
jgi:hypothetical protein